MIALVPIEPLNESGGGNLTAEATGIEASRTS